MCFATQFYRQGTTLNLYLAGTHIEQVDQYKYLGVVLDPKLNFNAYFDRLIGKSQQQIISRVCKYVSKNIALTLYKSCDTTTDFSDTIYMSNITE